MKQQVFALYKGMGHHQNSTYPIVEEYITRQRLAKIGFTSDLSTLPYYKAQAFCWISSEIDRLREQDLSRQRQKNGNR